MDLWESTTVKHVNGEANYCDGTIEHTDMYWTVDNCDAIVVQWYGSVGQFSITLDHCNKIITIVTKIILLSWDCWLLLIDSELMLWYIRPFWLESEPF